MVILHVRSELVSSKLESLTHSVSLDTSEVSSGLVEIYS